MKTKKPILTYSLSYSVRIQTVDYEYQPGNTAHGQQPGNSDVLRINWTPLTLKKTFIIFSLKMRNPSLVFSFFNRMDLKKTKFP